MPTTAARRAKKKRQRKNTGSSKPKATTRVTSKATAKTASNSVAKTNPDATVKKKNSKGNNQAKTKDNLREIWHVYVNPDGPVVLEIPIDRVFRNPEQPRKHFDKTEIMGLANSIEAKGMLDPISVMPHSDSEMRAKACVMIVDGERRLRAAKLKRFKTVPVILRDVDDQDLYNLSFVSNFCREEMTELEIAQGIKKLKSEGMTSVQIARLVGKSTGWVSNMLKFTELGASVEKKLRARTIKPVHAQNVSSYPKGQQGKLLSAIQEAEKAKGSPLTVHEVTSTVKKTAEALGIAPRPKKKRGRKQISHAEMVLGKTWGDAAKLKSVLEEVRELSHDKIEKAGGVVLLHANDNLRDLRVEIDTTLAHLDPLI